jgi:DNA-binding protein H-NS
MRIVRLLSAVVIVALGLSLLAPGAGASAPTKTNTKFCKAVEKITSGVTSNSSNPDAAAAKSLAKTTRKAAKTAPAKVQAAMQVMADYFQAIADAGSNRGKLVAAVAKNAQKYAKAAATYTSYYTSNCFGITTTTSA